MGKGQAITNGEQNSFVPDHLPKTTVSDENGYPQLLNSGQNVSRWHRDDATDGDSSNTVPTLCSESDIDRQTWQIKIFLN